ncbi:MAG: hypothetical protein CMF48_04785 [Legionellales bacterium]|nr:hypothetical protein [Legionellales bacterium]
MIDGPIAPGFEKIRDAFEENFTHRKELGAAVCIYLGGVKVVDLWGGYLDAEKKRAWTIDSRVMVFSVTKGMCALAMAHLVSKRKISYETKISSIWPEFSQHGKENITLRQLLEHRAGLFSINERITPELLLDKQKFSTVLAKQEPEQIGKVAYHAQTVGWYLSEICHRVDEQGRYIGQYLEEELIKPLNLNFKIGLDMSDDMSTVSGLTSHSAIELLFSETNVSLSMILQLLNPFSQASRALKNPHFSRPSDMIAPPWPYCEMPSSNGIGTVRSIACMWQLVLDKHYLPVRLREELVASLREDPVERPDSIIGHPMRYHYGFTRPGRSIHFGVSDQAIGFAGIGGAFSFADPSLGVTYAYAPNRLGPVMWDDPRERALRIALFETLESLGITNDPTQ